MKKSLLLTLVLALVFSLFACGVTVPSDAEPPSDTTGTDPLPAPSNRYESFAYPVEDFTPSARFIFASDIHVVDRGTKSLTMLRRMMTELYEYADARPYSAVDAVVLTGDITSNAYAEPTAAVRAVFDESLREETRLLLCLGNHDVIPEDSTFDAEAEAVALGGSLQTDAVVGGIPFVGLSSPNGSVHYFDEIADEIAARLAAAAEAADGMPIFVFQHFPPSDTLDRLFEKYPNIVNFYGHTHRAVNEYKSLQQDVFSQVNLSTFGSHGGGVGYNGNEEYAENYAICWVVEVDADGSVLIMPFDANFGIFLTKSNGDPFYYYIEKPGDTDSYQYRGVPTISPEFPDFNLRMELCTERGALLSYTTATDPNGIAQYSYTVMDKASGRILVNSACDCNYGLVPEPERRAFLAMGVKPGTECMLSIIAVNSCGRTSRALCVDFTVPDYFLPERRVSQDGRFTDFDSYGSFSAGGNLVYRSQYPGDFVVVGSDRRLNLFRYKNLSLTERDGNAMLSVRSGYNDTKDYNNLEFHLYATEENGIPNSYPGAEYLCLWADFTDVALASGDFGVISSIGTKYRLRPGVEYFFRADGEDNWTARTAGDETALGDTEGGGVKGLCGSFAFRLSDMEPDSLTSYGLVEQGSPPDATDIAGVFLEWKKQSEEAYGIGVASDTPFYIDDITLAADYVNLR